MSLAGRPSARAIAASAKVFHYPDGSRSIRWDDGVTRHYSKETLAAMFVESVERGRMNPILERLLTPREIRDMYRDLQTVSDDLGALVAAAGAIPQT